MSQTPRETSSRFGLPYIMPGQAQKHVTHNEAIRALDALLHISVQARNIGSPPEAPSEGESYLIGSAPIGEFADKADYIARFIEGAWMYYAPVQGLIVNVENEALCVIWRGDDWAEFGNGGDIDIGALVFDTFGVNAAADTFNRLVLNSHASLFNHDGAGHQLKVNKAAQSETASLLFQNGFSGRAEMGLVGDDDFAIKVSADGANFHKAMTVDSESGEARFPNSPSLHQPVIFNMLGDGGRFGGKPEPLNVRLENGFELPNYIEGFNGAIISQGDKYIDSSDNFGGNRGAMSSAMEALGRRFKPGAADSILRFGTEFYSAFVSAGGGTAGPLTTDGVTAYRALGGLRFPIAPRFTLSFWIRVISGTCFIGGQSHARLVIDNSEHAANAALPANGEWHHVQRMTSYDPASFLGYDVNLYRVYAAAGTQFEIAAPVLFPGHLGSDPERPVAIVNSLSAFM